MLSGGMDGMVLDELLLHSERLFSIRLVDTLVHTADKVTEVFLCPYILVDAELEELRYEWLQ